MKAVQILAIIIGIFGTLGLVFSLFLNIPLIIIYPTTWEGTIIHLLEWIGFGGLLISGICSFTKQKYSIGITNIFADISFLTLAAIIFVGLITFSWPFSTIIAYLIPCILTVLIIFDTATRDLRE